MKVSDLQEILDKHKADKSYKHRDLTWEQIDAKALLSFNRLSNELKIKVLKVCTHYKLTDINIVMRARFMAQTNLFLLCKMLGYDQVSDKEYTWTDGKTYSPHETVCNDFFVTKDPTQKDFKTFASKYVDKKKRLLLIPRGCFKSTIDMADVVQWIITYPEVTILILTGILDLAKDFVGEIKRHFTLEDADEKYSSLFDIKKNLKAATLKEGDLSLFQILFPEHCVPKDEGKGYEYQTPAVTQAEKECTVFAASIEQSLTGWHVGIMKLDDVVTNENSLTIDRLKAVNKQVSINSAMLHPFGFLDKIGTWYDSEDTYGQDIKQYRKAQEKGDDFHIKVFIRPAWWANEEARKAGKIEEEMTEQDYDLLFGDPENPHALTYQRLKEFRSENAEYFGIKYLNDPTSLHKVKFPLELLHRRTISANLIPGTGMIVTAIDTAYSTQSWADYTVITTALIYGGRFYIIDMQRGKYNEYELPAMIAATALKWKPKRICIEESTGVKWIGREIYREMDKLKTRSPLEFVSLGKGSKSSSKMMKAKPVLRYLGDDRLLFSNSCPNLEEMYDELSKFGTAAGLHDDIVDSLSLLLNQFSGYAEMEGKLTAQQANFNPDPFSKQGYDMIHGLGRYAGLQEMQTENPEMSHRDVIKAYFEAAQSDHDPLSDLLS